MTGDNHPTTRDTCGGLSGSGRTRDHGGRDRHGAADRPCHGAALGIERHAKTRSASGPDRARRHSCQTAHFLLR